MAVKNPLIRPYFLGGGIGGVSLDSMIKLKTSPVFLILLSYYPFALGYHKSQVKTTAAVLSCTFYIPSIVTGHPLPESNTFAIANFQKHALGKEATANPYSSG